MTHIFVRAESGVADLEKTVQVQGKALVSCRDEEAIVVNIGGRQTTCDPGRRFGSPSDRGLHVLNGRLEFQLIDAVLDSDQAGALVIELLPCARGLL